MRNETCCKIKNSSHTVEPRYLLGGVSRIGKVDKTAQVLLFRCETRKAHDYIILDRLSRKQFYKTPRRMNQNMAPVIGALVVAAFKL